MYDRNKNHNSSAVRKSSTWRIIETECKRWRMKGRDALKEGSRRHPHPALITTMDTAFTVLSRTVGDPQCDSLYKHFIKDCLHVSVVRVAFFFEEEILSLSRMIYVSFILFKRVLSLVLMLVQASCIMINYIALIRYLSYLQNRLNRKPILVIPQIKFKMAR